MFISVAFSLSIILFHLLFFSPIFAEFILICRALLHFLDAAKFNSKDIFVEKYKNLSSFNETEVMFFFLENVLLLT